MTLTRTIRRREQRKNAKRRRANPPRSAFHTPHWITAEFTRVMANDLQMAKRLLRDYGAK
jgi:hypothetical protein